MLVINKYSSPKKFTNSFCIHIIRNGNVLYNTGVMCEKAFNSWMQFNSEQHKTKLLFNVSSQKGLFGTQV